MIATASCLQPESSASQDRSVLGGRSEATSDVKNYAPLLVAKTMAISGQNQGTEGKIAVIDKQYRPC